MQLVIHICFLTRILFSELVSNSMFFLWLVVEQKPSNQSHSFYSKISNRHPKRTELIEKI